MTRLEAWKEATKLVEPIITQYGLERYSPGANIFASGTSVITPVDQCITHVMEVAEWLLKEEE